MGVDFSITGIPEFDKLEVVKTGVLTVHKNASSTSGSGVATHNLGYVPIVLGYYASGSSFYQLPYFSIITTGADGGKVYGFYGGGASTTSVVQFDFFTYDTSANYAPVLDYNVRYFLLRHSAITT